MIANLIIILALSSPHICWASTYDHYLLNCGTSHGEGDTIDGRAWSTDTNTTFSSADSFSDDSFSASLSANPPIPFNRARIFKSSFTYSFPVSPGPKFIRLFFHPALYADSISNSTFNASHSFISVQANHHLLLQQFRFVGESQSTIRFNISDSTEEFVMKEYIVSIPNNENCLNLTFTPYSFVNGIEVVSVPYDLYLPAKLKNVFAPMIPLLIATSSALETAYRLNVGGSDIGVEDDSGRQWKNDDPYLFLNHGSTGFGSDSIQFTPLVPYYTEPEEVYQTFRFLEFGISNVERLKSSLTWRLKVESGFNYMVRLHWCVPNINSTGELVFDVYINNQTADDRMDVMAYTKQKDVPIYRDYGVYAMSDHLWIELQPNTIGRYNDAELNGLEIFKINDTEGKLNSPNDELPLKGRKRPKLHPTIVASAIGGILLIASLLASILVYQRVIATKSSTKYKTRTTNYKANNACLRFSLSQIKMATNNFSEALIIGHGGFGNVYRATLSNSKRCVTQVAIKRLNSSSKQGVDEFITEIQMLSKIHHVHLVSLIGYCDERGEMILVYDYMKHGTLRDHLCNTNNPPLSWNLRLNICLGAAKGLHYLHAGVGHMIIHRDVKSTNILLDENWVPKVSDFGLSKLGPIGGDLHVSTAVKGSFGYMDPQYYMLQQLTEKSDVYSFGVVLFEVLCGRAAVDPNLPSEQVNLAMWARSYQQRGEVDTIVDPNIKDEIAPACLRKFGELAERCVREQRTERPSMVDVVWSLELALELQQHNMKFVYDDEFPFSMPQLSSLDESQSATMVSTSQSSQEECSNNIEDA